MIEPKLAPKTPFKKGRPLGVVVHTTGGALVAKAAELGVPPMVRAIQLYRNLMAEGPHWVIDQDGNVEAIQLPERIAYHVGTLVYNKLAAPVTQSEYAWWRSTFPDFRKVGDHPLWRVCGSVNSVTWGIEVIPPSHDSSAPWSDAAVDALADTLTGLPYRKFPFKRGLTVCTHSELSPYTRTARGLPWDLPPNQAEQLDEMVAFLEKNG